VVVVTDTHFICLHAVGYLSEAGASIVDTSLGLGIVPKTKVVRFVSPSFYYSKVIRTKTKAVKKTSERFPQVRYLGAECVWACECG